MINYVEVLKNNPSYFKQFSCKELLFLNYDCPVKEKKAAKWSEHNYFYYVLSGEKTLHTTNCSWELTSGSLVFVKKGACLVEQFFQEPFCIVVFIIPDSFISKFLHLNKGQLPIPLPHTKMNDLVLPVKTDDVLHAYYDSILPYFISPTKPSEKLIELKFTELLLHIANNPDNAELISYFHHVAAHKNNVLEQVMEANFPYNLELKNYASLCNRSLSTFKRDFEASYKMTPGRWLLMKRLEHACQLLATTSKDITEIMLESGFENQSHFNRVFKLRFGSSPLQFRKHAESFVK